MKNFGRFRQIVNAKKRHSFKLFTFNNPILKPDNLNAPFKRRNTITQKKMKIDFNTKKFSNQDIVISTSDEMVKEAISIQEKDETEKKR